MVTSRRLLGPVLWQLAAAAVLSGGGAAWADDARPPALPSPERAPAAASAPTPRVHHAPVSSARAQEDLRITAVLDHPEQVRSAAVVYRPAGGELKQTLLLRSEREAGYVAVIPGPDVRAPGLAYAIEIERVDGARVSVFGSRAEMQPVIVLEDHADVRERAALKRLSGHRSVVAMSGDYVGFGTTTGDAAIPCAAGQSSCPVGQSRVPSVHDQFWRAEIGYTYRPLRTVAEFGIKLGVVRGTSLVPLMELDTSKYSVGLNYGEPWVRFRMADAWHLEIAGLASISEVGFSIGGGTALLIGDPYGTRLTLGAEVVGFGSTYFGSRFYTKLDLLVREGITVGPAVEVTDMPHATTFGVRLYGDASFALPRGFGIGLRAGYQARRSTSGNVGAGGTVSYSF